MVTRLACHLLKLGNDSTLSKKSWFLNAAWRVKTISFDFLIIFVKEVLQEWVNTSHCPRLLCTTTKVFPVKFQGRNHKIHLSSQQVSQEEAALDNPIIFGGLELWTNWTSIWYLTAIFWSQSPSISKGEGKQSTHSWKYPKVHDFEVPKQTPANLWRSYPVFLVAQWKTKTSPKKDIKIQYMTED